MGYGLWAMGYGLCPMRAAIIHPSSSNHRGHPSHEAGAGTHRARCKHRPLSEH